MEDSSKMITVVISIIMASVVTFGAIKNKDRRQNGILNRAIKKTEHQSIACYCVDTMTDRKITNHPYYSAPPALRNISVLRMPKQIVL